MTHPARSHAAAGHGTHSSYLIGFAASVALTALAFAVVLAGGLPGGTTFTVIAALAVVQIFVHLVCFLHMNSSSAQGWNVSAFAFTVVIVAVVILGTVWVMHNANLYMMPHN